MDVRFLGTTDDVTTCECCGRADLKSTVVLSIDDSDPVHFGCVCAARAIGRSAVEVRRAAKRADDAAADAAEAARNTAHRAFMARWEAFLMANAPAGHDVFTRIQALGGMKAARAAFEVSQVAE